MKEKCIILISHSNYRIRSSGVEKYLTEITKLIMSRNIHCIHMFPVIEVNKRYRRIGSDRFYIGINVDGEYAGIDEAGKIERLCTAIKDKFEISGVQIHHLKGWRIDVLKTFLTCVDKEIRLFVHDHMMVCSYNMMLDNFMEHCHGDVHVPDEIQCKYCPDYDPAISTYNEIRNLINDLDEQIKNIVVPSEICKEIWLKSFGYLNKNIVIREHCKFDRYDKPSIQCDKLRVAYIGGISDHKGIKAWNTVVDCFKDDDAIEFFYLGIDELVNTNVKIIKVDFQDKTLPTMKETLINNGINCVFLWSLYPETFSYTYYEAMDAGCYVLTNDHSGNICASVGKYNNGRIFEDIGKVTEYLGNPQAVCSELREYRDSRKIPAEISLNDSMEELLFDGGGQLFTRQKNVFRYRKLWTLIYKLMRAKKYK